MKVGYIICPRSFSQCQTLDLKSSNEPKGKFIITAGEKRYEENVKHTVIEHKGGPTREIGQGIPC